MEALTSYQQKIFNKLKDALDSEFPELLGKLEKNGIRLCCVGHGFEFRFPDGNTSRYLLSENDVFEELSRMYSKGLIKFSDDELNHFEETMLERDFRVSRDNVESLFTIARDLKDQLDRIEKLLTERSQFNKEQQKVNNSPL